MGPFQGRGAGLVASSGPEVVCFIMGFVFEDSCRACLSFAKLFAHSISLSLSLLFSVIAEYMWRGHEP